MSPRTGRAQPALECPGCGASAPAAERFCAQCGLPLVRVDEALPEPDERRRRARMIKPQLTEGPLMKVAWVRNQAEGELIQSLLLEHGVPSLLRRSPGFDVPDMLFAGPRDVMVAASGVDIAREALLGAGMDAREQGRARPVVRPWPLAGGLVAALVAVALVCWLLSLIVAH